MPALAPVQPGVRFAHNPSVTGQEGGTPMPQLITELRDADIRTERLQPLPRASESDPDGTDGGDTDGTDGQDTDGTDG